MNQLSCPKCGHNNSMTSRFCANCGAKGKYFIHLDSCLTLRLDANIIVDAVQSSTVCYHFVVMGAGGV